LSIDVASAAVLGLVGDVACQLGERQVAGSSSEPFDMRRLASITVYSAAYTGMFCNVLYQTYPHIVGFLARRLTAATSALRPTLLRESSALHNCSCSVVDNVHCGLIYIPTYFISVGALKGEPMADSTANLRREWRDAYITCSLYWMPFMAWNFAFVPAHGVRPPRDCELARALFTDCRCVRRAGESDGGGELRMERRHRLHLPPRARLVGVDT